LGELNYANLEEDTANPTLAKVILERGNNGVGRHIGSVRQFFMNLACSDPDDPDQLQDYQTEYAKKRTIHLAYDAAVMLLGKRHGKAASSSSNIEPVTAADASDNEPEVGAGDDEEEVEDEFFSGDGPSVAEMVEAAYKSVKPDEFMLALQDKGQQKERRSKGRVKLVTVWPDLDKQALKMRRAVGKLGHCPWLPQNTTTVKKHISTELQLVRTRKPIKNVHRLARQHFAKANPKAKEIEL